MIRVRGNRFVDEHDRTLMLRGVNVGSKTPAIGRPFPLDEADEHFARLKSWGLTTLRLFTTWEGIEPNAPGVHDLAYVDWFEALVARAGAHGLNVFIDFHQDVWSRFTGGDGAPRWTLEAAGFVVDNLEETGAAVLSPPGPGPMVWPMNAGLLGCATMFTLFFAGDRFAPRLKLQRELQERYFAAVERVVRRVASMPHVFGVDLMNEPSPGYIGWADTSVAHAPVENGPMPTPLQSMALGMGEPVEVETRHRGLLGVKRGQKWLNPYRQRAWKESCPWLEHGAWHDKAYFAGVRWVDECYAPFITAGAARVHAISDRLAVMIEGEPFKDGPAWHGGNFVWAPHWYDGFALFLKRYSRWVAADSFTQRPVFLPTGIRRSFARQLGRLATDAERRGLPLLVGELGVPYMPGHAPALDRTLTAVEDAGVSACLWNYTPSNTRALGDGWNGEDLSVFSRDGGARSPEAFVRPYPAAVAGTVASLRYERRRLELEVDVDVSVKAPTEVFAVGAREVQVSEGEVVVEPLRVRWTHGAGGRQRLTLVMG